MLQEILTLVVDKIPTQYYINFEKERKTFFFQPTLKSKSAPAFVIEIRQHEMVCEGVQDVKVIEQAKEKVKEILSNTIFDQI